MNSAGTLGGGNHYIEIGVSKETGDWYLIVHTGSRNLGLQVYKYWKNIAETETQNRKSDVSALVAKLKSEGRESEIESKIKILKKNNYVPKELSFVSEGSYDGYLHDLDLCASFAQMNRETILKTIMGKLGILNKKTEKGIKTTVHNYIDQSSDIPIIRKGSIRALADEEVLIPMNMRDGSLLCIGKGNPDWNYSAPHGAGRIMSRGEAKRNVSMEEYRKSMEGIYTTSVNESTLDESPMAYKSAAEIESLIGDTVEVREHLVPVYNFKAGEFSLSWK